MTGVHIGSKSGASGSYDFREGSIVAVALHVLRGNFDWSGGTLDTQVTHIGGDTARAGTMNVDIANWIYEGVLVVNTNGTLDLKSNTLTLQASGDASTATVNGGPSRRDGWKSAGVTTRGDITARNPAPRSSTGRSTSGITRTHAVTSIWTVVRSVPKTSTSASTDSDRLTSAAGPTNARN